MKRKLIPLLCILALVLASLACDPTPTPEPGGLTGNDDPAWGIRATETYGAEEWHAQLTAIERDRLGTEEP